jgi:hypothetical protein
VHGTTAHRSIFFSGSNAWLLLFVFNSIVIQMVLGQDSVIVRFSSIYWALVLPAMMIPRQSLGQMVRVLRGPGIALLAFLVCAGTFHLARGDVQTVAQLFLLVWMIAWCACESVRITTADFVKVFVGSIVLGALVALFTDLNPWGLFPRQTTAAYGAWRVSFFPHVANSAILSLIAFMFLTRNASIARHYKAVLALCIYFILFGFVRTVLVASVLYLSLRIIYAMTRTVTPRFLFGSSLIIAIGAIACELSIGPVLEMLQGYPLASRLFLRGETGLDPSAIYEQLYRPWLWKEHFSIFASSPHFMGLGTFRLLDHVSYNLVPGLDASGSESFPTRLLAVYGLPTLFLAAYLLAQLWRRARANDAWACACFPAIFFMMMNWGSVFHPTNVMFVLFFLLLKGERAVADHPSNPVPQVSLTGFGSKGPEHLQTAP